MTFLDQSVLEALKPWKKEIETLRATVIGRTEVFLEHSEIRESNIGNLITDAMVYWVIILLS